MPLSAVEAEKNAAKFPPNKTRAQRILRNAQDSRPIIQDFVPLAESLEWELGQQYLRDRGNKAFISDSAPVPFVVNNDSNLSRNAAEVFLASLIEAEKSGDLEPDIYVLEFGIGVGLFARFFLDDFEQLCEKHGKDYYDRLIYIAADRSERMLADVIRHGVLADHPGRYQLRLVDAMEPQRLLQEAGLANHPRKGRPFRAVFLNYLLDCLPASMLQLDGDEVKQLHVRTCLARNVNLSDFTDLTLSQLRQRAASREARAREELLEVYGLFASVYDFCAADIAAIPYGGFGLEYGGRTAKRFLLSHGAIHALERLQALTAEEGFILINDYGQTMTTNAEEFEHQRFGMATFVGVNFPLLKEYFAQPEKGDWIEPSTEAGGIHSRLLCRKPADELLVKFRECFSAAAHEHVHEPVQKARGYARAGRFELAASCYDQAVERQPRNWLLCNEISMFLTFSLRDVKAGIAMAKQALELNPSCSAELWNTLGDGLFEAGRTEEARSTYHQALQVSETDVRARYNLAWCHLVEKNFPAALAVIAEALALDRTGEFRDKLLQKQGEVVQQVARRHQQEYLLLINLVSKFAKKDEADNQIKPTQAEAGQAPNLGNQ